MNSPGISDLPYDEGLTWGQVMQFSFFYDYAQGYDNFAIEASSPKVHIAGYGFSFQFNHPDFLFTRISVGVNEISDSERNQQVTVDKPLIFAEFRYTF